MIKTFLDYSECKHVVKCSFLLNVLAKIVRSEFGNPIKMEVKDSSCFLQQEPLPLLLFPGQSSFLSNLTRVSFHIKKMSFFCQKHMSFVLFWRLEFLSLFNMWVSSVLDTWVSCQLWST